jgi:hypothetical protein
MPGRRRRHEPRQVSPRSRAARDAAPGEFYGVSRDPAGDVAGGMTGLLHRACRTGGVSAIVGGTGGSDGTGEVAIPRRASGRGAAGEPSGPHRAGRLCYHRSFDPVARGNGASVAGRALAEDQRPPIEQIAETGKMEPAGNRCLRDAERG